MIVTNSKNMRAHNTYYDCRMQLSVLLAAVVVNTSSSRGNRMLAPVPGAGIYACIICMYDVCMRKISRKTATTNYNTRMTNNMLYDTVNKGSERSRCMQKTPHVVVATFRDGDKRTPHSSSWR